MQSLISIIIPTYNRYHIIGRTLDSIIGQTYKNWECIVVDDKSCDFTGELMRFYCDRDSRIQYHILSDEKIPGGNAARNYGFKLSKGRYIQWFDSDDLMVPEKLRLHVEALDTDKYICCVSKAEFFKGKKWSEIVIQKSPFESLIKQETKWAVNSVTWKRTFVKGVQWNEKLQGGQEWEFHLRSCFHLEKDQIIIIDRALDKIREGIESKTGNLDIVLRYSNYLKARIYICEFLIQKDVKKFQLYFPVILKQSLKYIRLLLKNNKFQLILIFSRFVKKYSKIKYYQFLGGIVLYKMFGKNYLLKKTKV